MVSSQKALKKGTRYTDEVRNQALSKLATKGYTLNKVAKEMGVSVPTLINWKRKAKENGYASGISGLAGAPSGRGPVEASGSASFEISRLKYELAKLLEERDRLRKGIAALIGN